MILIWMQSALVKQMSRWIWDLVIVLVRCNFASRTQEISLKAIRISKTQAARRRNLIFEGQGRNATQLS